MQSVEQRFLAAIDRYRMVRPGDRVILAVSGGKDSFTMLDLFCRLRQSHFPDNDFRVCTIETDLTCSGSIPADVVRKRALDHTMEYERIYFPISEESGDRGIDCFYCALRRRTALIRRAFESGYNVVALGHHLDDIVETLLMNMMHHANISTMSPKVPMFQGRLSFIRPLCLVYEKETRVYASTVTTLPTQKPCPGMTGTARKDTKVFLDHLEELSPGTRLNFFRALASLSPPNPSCFTGSGDRDSLRGRLREEPPARAK